MRKNKNNKKKASGARLQDRFRIFIQAFSFAFHNGYILGWIQKTPYSGKNKTFCMPGLNCYSCPGAIGACPIGSLQAVLDSGSMKVSLYVLGFIGAVGMLCGRFVCGWLCPFGAVQDLLYRIPLFKKIKNLPGHKYLRWLKYAVLIVFVIVLPMVVTGPAGTGQPWFCEWICPSGTLLGGIPLVLMNSSLRASAGWRFVWKVAVLLLVLIGSVKLYRPFCKYICPLGALYGACNKLSLYRLKVDEAKCVACGACQKACGMDIPVWQKPNSIECIRCGKCMAACPTGAITSTWKDLLRKKPLIDGEVTDTVPSNDVALDPSANVAADAVAYSAPTDTVPVATENAVADATPVATEKNGAPASNPPSKGKWPLAVLLGIISLGAFGFGAMMTYFSSATGSGADALNFFYYLGNSLAALFAGICGIVYTVKFIGWLKHPERDMKGLAKAMSLLILGSGLVLSLLVAITAFLSRGISGHVLMALLKLYGSYVWFWLVPAAVVALSGRCFRQRAKDR